MEKAIWTPCPGMKEGSFYHSMRDCCTSCAPFWERIPTCPTCARALHKTGKVMCKTCRKFVVVED